MTFKTNHRVRLLPVLAAVGALYGLTSLPAQASSHREAPFIATAPKVDGTDFYMFRSYEPTRMAGPAYVTMLANYQPLQDAYGGPNYFKMDPNALYEIHIDNTGTGKEAVTFQFRFNNVLGGADKTGIKLPIGTAGSQKSVAIPLTQAGQITAPNSPASNVTESFTVTMVRGDRRTGAVTTVGTFAKPVDNIGTKTIPDYAGYAAQHIYDVNIPGCGASRIFAGQRKDPFAVNLGVIFDLINIPGTPDFSAAETAFITDPAQKDAGTDDLRNKNVTTLAIEVPASCLVNGSDPVIGGWTTASLRQGRLLSSAPKSGLQTSEIVGGAWTQVSRLGNPLINELVIGLPDKDKFNGSKPADDGQFATYVTNPTLPKLIEVALNQPGIAPVNFPRNDLVVTFLSGIPKVNQPAAFAASPSTGVLSEEMRLNTTIAPTAYAMQNRLGLLGGLLGPAPQDLAGYPNGRRPNDDVVDISLVAVMGGLCVANGYNNALGFGSECRTSAVPLGTVAYNLHDGVDQAGPKVKAAGPLLPGFPYLGTPLPGAK